MNTESVSINQSDDEDTQLSSNEDESHTQTGQASSTTAAATTQQQPAAASATKNSDIASNLFKWTNYIHGWQERYVVLKDGVLSYYKSQSETQYGCRGAIALKQSSIISHELDDCRFDIRVNDCVWYLRAKTTEERQKWVEMLEEYKVESGYGSQASLRRHGSLLSLNSTASASVASTGSNKRVHGLKEKLAEMETFKEILSRQVETLQTYFDACANSQTGGFEPYHKELEKKLNNVSDDEDSDETDSDVKTEKASSAAVKKSTQLLSKATMEDHAGMAIDFKGEAYTFKATTAGILHNMAHCIELMQQREEFLKKKLEKEVERRKKAEEHAKELAKGRKQQTVIIAGPDFEEGPHSNIKEEQFFDAIDSTLDTLEQEDERRMQAMQSLTHIPELKPVKQHRLSEEIERITQDHLKFDLIDDFNSNVWELICSDGEMKVYRRELEENGIVLDPLKATHTVKGITGHELCKYFWDPAVRMEWEATLDSSRVIEALSDDTLIFHQTLKRVWPAAQRETCFWSHLRAIPITDESRKYQDMSDWIVINYSTNHDMAPIKEPLIRATANVALTVNTYVIDKEKFPDKASVPRKNIVCKITYVANAPDAVLSQQQQKTDSATNADTKSISSNSSSSSNKAAAASIDRSKLICKITYVALINPGGWVPANALRTVYKREYPKFLQRFTKYVIDKTTKLPILF